MGSLIQISVKDDFEASILAIKKAFKDLGYERMFSPFVVNAVIFYFENKDWGKFLDKKESKIYTTEQILHDNMQNDLHGESKWIKL